MNCAKSGFGMCNWFSHGYFCFKGAILNPKIEQVVSVCAVYYLEIIGQYPWCDGLFANETPCRDGHTLAVVVETENVLSCK